LRTANCRTERGAAKKGCFLYGTDGSNPSPSSGESNETSAPRLRHQNDCIRLCAPHRSVEERVGKLYATNPALDLASGKSSCSPVAGRKLPTRTKIACFAKSSMRVCARIKIRLRCAAPCRTRHRSRRQGEHGGLSGGESRRRTPVGLRREPVRWSIRWSRISCRLRSEPRRLPLKGSS